MAKVIGIDLGTTNCVVSVYEKGKKSIVSINGRNSVPSVVCWKPNTNKLLVGKDAKSSVVLYPSNSVISNKRNIGDRNTQYYINDKTYTPTDISSILLKYIKDEVEKTLGEEINQAVITVPAYFNSNQNKATKTAAEKAGFEVLQLLAEPTAAAIAYGLDQNKDQTIMVYDLGGGTFDITILEVKGNKFNVLATGGDSQLGGDDFDEAILDYLIKDIKSQFDFNLDQDDSKEGRAAKQKLKEYAEKAKIELTIKKKAEIYEPSLMNFGPFSCEITQKKYKELIQGFLNKTIHHIYETLEKAGKNVEDINRVICVGGSTKSPFVQEVIAENIKQPFIAPNVDEIVAQGAAIYASMMFNPENIDYRPGDVDNRPIDLTNITPFDLGIRVENNRMNVLIPRNSKLPAVHKKTFTTTVNYVTEINIEVFQGNDEMCHNNTPLSGFTIKGIQRAKKGMPVIEVTFESDISNILKVTAKDRSTGKENRITINTFESSPFKQKSENTKTLKDLYLGASRVGYDDVGAILTEMNLPWKLVKDPSFAKKDILEQFDILFINCLSGGNSSDNKLALRTFVENGGILYASDCAQDHISQAFPNNLTFEYNDRYHGDKKVRVISDEFAQALGKKEFDIHFNSVLYHCGEVLNPDGEVFIEGSETHDPIVVGFPYGKGYVIYTAFHNYGGAKKEEIELLKYVLLKPVSIATNTPLKEIEL